MKKNKLIIFLIFATMISFILVSCENTTSRNIEGFEVEATDTVNIGTNYMLKMPSVTIDEEPTNVYVRVYTNERQVPVIDNERFYVTSFDDYLVEFIVMDGHKEIIKTTTVSVIDDIDPIINFESLPNSIYYGMAFNLDQHIKTADNSGQFTTTYTVKDSDTDEVIEVDEHNNIFIDDESSTTTLVVTVDVEDGKGNTASDSKTIHLMERPLYGDVENFENVDINAVLGEARFAGQLENIFGNIIADEADSYLRLTTIDGISPGTIIAITFNDRHFNDLSKFQTLTMKIRWTFAEEQAGEPHIADFYFQNLRADVHKITSGSSWTDITVNVADIFANNEITNFKFDLRKSTGLEHAIHFDIALVAGGYNELSYYEGTTVNLFNSFDLSAEELEDVVFYPVSGNSVDVEDPTSFSPRNSNGDIVPGTLEFIVNKEGYKKTPVSVDVALVEGDPFEFGEIMIDGRTPINLLEHTGFSEDSITTVSFNGEPVEDLESFLPTEKGELSLQIKLKDETIVAKRRVYFANSYEQVESFNEMTTDVVSRLVFAGQAANVSSEIKEEDDNPYLSITTKDGVAGTILSMGLVRSKMIRLDQFETITFRIRAKYVDGSNTDKLLNFYLQSDRGDKRTLFADGSWVEVTFNRTAPIGATFYFDIQKLVSDNKSLVFDIDFVSGGFKNITTSQTTNLLQTTGLTQGDILSATFAGETIEDLTAFVPNETGIVTLLVRKDGFIDSTIEIRVTNI